MNNQAKNQSLLAFVDRVAYVMTDLNGHISSVVNEEITLADFDDDLTQLFEKLTGLVGAVSELVDVCGR